MRMNWPVLSGRVYCAGITDVEALFREMAGQLEREGLSKLEQTGRSLEFTLAFPLIVRLTLSSWIGSGRICVDSNADGLTISYRFSWFRVLACAVLVVAMLFLAVVTLGHGGPMLRDPAWLMWPGFAVQLGFAVLLGYAGARMTAKAFVRACVRHAGGIPLRKPPSK